MGEFSVTLAKADFKFSAAHFTLFGDAPAELLHGHNYRVGVDLIGTELDGSGLLLDISALKRRIRDCCERLDEHTLIPEHSEAVEIDKQADGVEVRFEGRRYVLPSADVELLPLENISMELLARWLWTEIAPALAGSRVQRMTLTLEETDGQSAAYSAAL